MKLYERQFPAERARGCSTARMIEMGRLRGSRVAKAVVPGFVDPSQAVSRSPVMSRRAAIRPEAQVADARQQRFGAGRL